MSAVQVAVVVSGFPRRSETFALHELLGLADRGMLAGVYATKPGDAGDRQPDSDRLMPMVEYLRDGDQAEQGGGLAARLAGRRVDGIHAYFAHTPAGVAELAASRLGVPFGFSIHAKDARKIDREMLDRRAGRARCVVACNDDVARQLQGSNANAHLVPHGVDLRRFRPAHRRRGKGLKVLAVGRLVQKKGFDILIDAVASAPGGVTLRIVGEGPERERLRARIAVHGIRDRVTLAGPCTHAVLPAAYADADVVAVPSIVDPSGDRDGLPNVVLEAMASGAAVVGTDVGAIGRAVKDGRTGLLIEPSSAEALSAALRTLASDEALRVRLGRAARAEVERYYALDACVDRFARLLEASYA